MTIQAYFQVSGTVLAGLILALLVTSGYLPKAASKRVTGEVRIPGARMLAVRGLVGVVGITAATLGVSFDFRALLRGSPVGYVEPVSWFVGSTLACLAFCAFSEAAEVALSYEPPSGWSPRLMLGASFAVCALASILLGGEWVFVVRAG